jgi:hypothetical protein
MKRILACLTLLALGQPAWAGDAPYYGPAKKWHGIGYKFGYEDRTEKDGTWRTYVAIHGGGADAIDMALYRTAERAREQGYRYVFFLGGSGSKSPGIDAATVYAMPSREAVPPVGCRSKKVTTCYTADVGEVLRILGGPGGTRPGVPILDHRDEAGREVFLSGYGTGAVATLVPGAVARSHMTTVVENRRPKVSNTPVAAAEPEALPSGTVVPSPPIPAIAFTAARDAAPARSGRGARTSD